MIQLRDGSVTTDRRLDRLVQFDERSREWPIRSLLGSVKKRRSFTWRIDPVSRLDQGNEGACVGFSCVHELAARPAEVQVSDALARWVYREAQKIDPWEGEDYEGTSLLSGVKILHKEGWFRSYRWAFGLEDLILGVGYNGPAAIGVNWYSGMMKPDSSGFIRPTGRVEGGHAILVNAVNVKEEWFNLPNSWGTDWGVGGDCRLSFADMGRLLHEDGEAVFMMERRSRL